MNHAWSTLAYSQLVPAVPAQVQPPSAAAASWRRRNSAAVTNHTSVTDPGTAAHHGLHPSPRQNSPSSSCIQPCTPPAGRYMPPPNRGWRRGRHRTRHAQRSTSLATVPASSARRCLPLTLHHDQPALPCCLRRLTSRRRSLQKARSASYGHRRPESEMSTFRDHYHWFDWFGVAPPAIQQHVSTRAKNLAIPVRNSCTVLLFPLS